MKKFISLFLSATGIVTVLPLFATAATSEQTVPPVSINAQCMQQAVNERGSALINAFDVFHDAITLALKNRITAESNAWGESDVGIREKALRDAAKVFDGAYRKASKDLERQKHSTWQQYEADSKACRTKTAPAKSCVAYCPDGKKYNSCVQYFADPCINHSSSSSSVFPPVTVSEQVKCIFNGSTTEQKCYNATESDTPYPFSCSGITRCVAELKGAKGLSVTWKSTCGGYAYTTLDGESEYATFDCNKTAIPAK